MAHLPLITHIYTGAATRPTSGAAPLFSRYSPAARTLLARYPSDAPVRAPLFLQFRPAAFPLQIAYFGKFRYSSVLPRNTPAIGSLLPR